MGFHNRFFQGDSEILPKFIQRFNAIPMKMPAKFFVDADRTILKFTGKGKGFRIAKSILKMKCEELHYLILRLFIHLQ